jgi:polyisoprenoid-binding protein YceI
MKIHRVTCLFLLVSAAAACNNPAKDKPKAEVTEAVQAPSAAPPVGAVVYKFGPPDSKIEWVGAKVTGKHDGAFGSFSGTITVPEGKPENGNVTAEIDIASISSDNEKLTGHLKSGDFFEVEKFPKGRFTSTSIKAGGDQGRTHTVTGNLELRGVTKSVTFPATINVANDAVKVDAEFAINRKDWGIVYAGKPDDLIRDDVVVKLSLNGKKSE